VRILVIEDEATVARWIQMVLGEDGHHIDVAPTAADARRLTSSLEYDLAVVDLDLPDGNGLSVVQAMRGAGRATPILVLTGHGDDDGVVAGLDAGADDYLVKPVPTTVLRARVRAALRRGGATRTETLSVGALSMDRLRRIVKAGDATLSLSPKEFRLLEYFMLRPEQVVPRAELLERVWGMRFDTFTNVVDTTVSRLRQKLASGAMFPRLMTVRGTGFVLSSSPEP